VAELWRPDVPGDLPVVALIHGGFWRQVYTKRLMHRCARAVMAHGWVAYNIEYRRTGPMGAGGWPETFTDIADAIDALADMRGIDHSRIVTCGHSAGGHLALWAASSRSTGTPSSQPRTHSRIHTAISLAGVVDLEAAARLGVGGDAIAALMGGPPAECADRYVLGSPASCLPMGIPQLLIHGSADSTVPASLSHAYVEQARAKGDDARYVPVPGAGHMDMIEVGGAAFTEVLARLEQIAQSELD
jgi:acetyl esterase/lipase